MTFRLWQCFDWILKVDFQLVRVADAESCSSSHLSCRSSQYQPCDLVSAPASSSSCFSSFSSCFSPSFPSFPPAFPPAFPPSQIIGNFVPCCSISPPARWLYQRKCYLAFFRLWKKRLLISVWLRNVSVNRFLHKIFNVKRWGKYVKILPTNSPKGTLLGNYLIRKIYGSESSQ